MNCSLQLLIWLSVLLFLTGLWSVEASNKSPIIFIPGILGSQFYARVNSTFNGCKDRKEWFLLWADYELLIPSFDKCFVDYTKLIYDTASGGYMNSEGVEIRVPDFGGLEAVEYLTGSSGFQYLHNFVMYFEKQGYIREKDLNAAPYDWRLAPDGLSQQGYYDNLYQLIEDSYQRNNHTPVTLIAHSLGGPITKYFLTTYLPLQNSAGDWKDTHIKQFVSLSGAFGGSMETVLSLVSGRGQQELPSMSPLLLRELQRSFPSVFFLLPSLHLWSKGEVIVSRMAKNYTVYDYGALFYDAKIVNGSRMLHQFTNTSLYDVSTPPNVTMYCFYGNNVSTPEVYLYEGDSFPDQQPHIKYGNGDGTVNERSLRSCEMWKGKQDKSVYMKSFSHISHMDMASYREILESIKDIVMN